MRTLLLALAFPVVAGAQTTVDTLSLAGRSTLMFGLGLTGSRTATASFGQSTAHTAGEAVSLAFNHWVRPQIGLSISVSVLDANASAKGASASATAITPILFGMTYSPRELALTRSIRPFIGAAVGPYIRSVGNAVGTFAEGHSESVAGAKLSAGANWFVGRHFSMSLEGAYHAVSNFERQDAGTKNPSGFGMSFSLGFGWGGN